MTPISRECLLHFLNSYPDRISGSIADYGSGEWSDEIRKILASGGITDFTSLDYDTGVDLMKPIEGKKFDVGITMDLLEHVTNPFIVADNISESLKDGALLFVTVPFVWCLHECPKDYFRFTTDGVKVIFPKLHCIRSAFRTDVAGHWEVGAVNDPDWHWITRVVAIFEKKGRFGGNE